MRHSPLSVIAAFALFCVVPVNGYTAKPVTWKATPSDPSGYVVITQADDLPALIYLEFHYGIESITETEPLPEGILAQLIYPNGKTVTIPQASGGIRLSQDTSFPPIANTCDAEELTTGFPYEASGSDLPYEVTFDTIGATDSGDYRGNAADMISRPGGHDGFIRFTPDQSGTYLFANSATKGDFAPIPDHEFERGFGGIGVWTGDCSESLTEIGTANSIVGDSRLSVSLEAGTTYHVIWEDYFVGSTENSVTLSIEYLGEPVGNTLEDSISLVDTGWNFDITTSTAANSNLADNQCVEDLGGGTGHGSGGSGLTGNEIWYRLPSTTPGTEYTVSIEAVSPDSLFVDSALELHAYSLETHTVSFVACNNDRSEDDRLSSITFVAEPMRIYYIMAESVPGFDQEAFGTFRIVGTAPSTSVGSWMIHERFGGIDE